MGAFSIWHLIVVLVIVFVLFGAGKLPRVMGDIGKGIKSLKDGLKDGEKSKSKVKTKPKILKKKQAKK